MDLIINFIGIILLFQTVSGGKTTYTIYLPDGRNDPAACASFIPEHYGFIRVTTPIDESKINWPYIPCNQGADCKLFPLDKDEIKMTGINPGGGTVDVRPTAQLMPSYKDFNSYPITPATAAAASVATMSFSTGQLTGIGLGNGMLHTRLSIQTIGSDIKIEGRNNRSLVVPMKSSVDILNLPLEIALGTPGTQMGGGDRVHYFLYHKLADKEPTGPCKAPGDPKSVASAAMNMGGPSAGEVSLSIACSNTNYP